MGVHLQKSWCTLFARFRFTTGWMRISTTDFTQHPIESLRISTCENSLESKGFLVWRKRAGWPRWGVRVKPQNLFYYKSMGEQTLDFYLSVIVSALLWAEMPLFQQPRSQQWNGQIMHVRIPTADPWNTIVYITIPMNYWLWIWNHTSWMMPVGPEKSSTHNSYLFRPLKVGNSYPSHGCPRLSQTDHFV
jgi:hypothetical protein